MIAIPAVDLKGGRCVQLVGGRPEEERVSLPDPASVAARWFARGFSRLHVVDLDAALGSGDNGETIDAVRRATDAVVQVGGGIRSEERAASVLETVDRIVVGTRAVDDPDWLAALARRFPGRVVLALDTRDGHIVRAGWTETTDLALERYLPGLAALPLAGILTTDVGREGRLEGIDRDGCRRAIEASPHPLIVSGGVTTLDEMAWLDEAGAWGAVLGMAIYTDRIDIDELARRWGGKEGTT